MATDANITRLMKSARIQLPGALDDTLKHELFSVVDEFCRRSDVWQETLEVTTTSGKTTYDIESDEMVSVVNRLMYVQNKESKTGIKATMATPEELVLKNEPNSAYTMNVVVALTVDEPLDDNSFPRMPSWIWEKYRDDILDGLLGRMMSQPAKPYTNDRMAIYHMRRFRNATAKARVEAHHRNLKGANRWRFPQTFAGRKVEGR